MVSKEEHSEYMQQKWLSRLAQERLELSVSVEEALEDVNVDEPLWLQDTGEEVDSVRVESGKTLIPPRLSLQSRPLPAVQPGDFVRGASSVQRALSFEKVEEDRPSTTAAHSNVLLRFAQRLTSSFAAMSAPRRSDGTGGQLPAAASSSVEPQAATDSQMITHVPPAEPRAAWKDSVALPAAHMQMPAQDIFRAELSTSTPAVGQSKQRLAGRSSRIRLETAPIPATPHSQALPQTPVQETSVSALPLVRRMEASQPARIANTPADSAQPRTIDVPSPSQSPLPSSETDSFKANIDVAARSAFSGSCVFEFGQGDVTVLNPAITASSVVLVTLTSNPGPVVVQYISLQPQIGFTIHLTAPTTMRTSFNYIILPSQLF